MKRSTIAMQSSLAYSSSCENTSKELSEMCTSIAATNEAHTVSKTIARKSRGLLNRLSGEKTRASVVTIVNAKVLLNSRRWNTVVDVAAVGQG